jgi:hypothetical protein
LKFVVLTVWGRHPASDPDSLHFGHQWTQKTHTMGDLPIVWVIFTDSMGDSPIL